MNKLAFGFLVSATTAFSFGSMAVVTGGNVFDQTVAAGAFDYSVYVKGTGGVGSGGLFDIVSGATDINNRSYYGLCFLTADHVVAGSTLTGIRFNGPGGASFDVGNQAGAFTQVRRLGFDGNQDLAFVGMKIYSETLSAAQKTYLNALTSQTGNLKANQGGVGNVLDSYGYGSSAKDIRTISGKTGFYTEFADPSANTGTHRRVDLRSKGTGTVASGPYDYNAVKWDVENVNTRGQINSGDSGGVIRFGSDWVGINTYAVGLDVLNGGGATIGELFEFGSEGGGLLFSQQDINWLGDECTTFAATAQAVPEPCAMVALSLGVVGLLRRKKTA